MSGTKRNANPSQAKSKQEAMKGIANHLFPSNRSPAEMSDGELLAPLHLVTETHLAPKHGGMLLVTSAPESPADRERRNRMTFEVVSHTPGGSTLHVRMTPPGSPKFEFHTEYYGPTAGYRLRSDVA